MTSKEVKLVITTAPSKGKKCVSEVLNRIILKDETAKAEEVVQNVVLVKTSLPSFEAYGLVISAPPSCARKIFPVLRSFPSSDVRAIIDEISELLLKSKVTKFFVNCYVRTSDFDCKVLEIGIGLRLKGIAEVDYKNPEKVVHVNVINGTAYVSLMGKDQEKVSVKSLS
ncbi:MAG: THUMP domain-containing protein [Candidatus Aramenus sp.]|jgi:tRNA acetyltransferase TAN1|nr:THUMP domain-containing protein [Candidatus Aramenus sp.]